jgi:Family of unknown function (DUF5709)
MTIPNDPESEGIPDVADDNSTAYDDYDRPRFNDSPASLPVDGAVAVDDYGVTAFESSRDEPLSARLVREQKDVSANDPETAADDEIADEAMSEEAVAQSARDADAFGFDERDLDLNEPPPGEVGRLIASDEGGSFEDDEAQSIAYDSREREGQAPEEAAMHEVPGEEVTWE